MELKSSAFSHRDMIPIQYTCDDQNISPPLAWENIPKNTQSLALIVDDPDAPKGTWSHWILYNLPPSLDHLEENAHIFPEPTKIGLNSWNKKEYGGPCPPSGVHRYFFKLYALDRQLPENARMTRESLIETMKNHVLEEAILMGRYECIS